jgi:ABC-2 type transport system permease protein
MRRHLKTMTMAAVRSLDDRGWALAGDFGLRLLRVVLLLSLWRTVLPETGATSGMTRAAVLTYTLVAEVFASQISLGTNIELALHSGDIANRFLRPAGVFGQFTAEMVGAGLRNLLLFSLPLFCLAPLLGVNPLPAGVGAALLFACSLVFALLVAAALDFIFASVMVLLEHSVYAMMKLRTAISALLSGAVIPLALMPWQVGDVLGYLPFAALASAPLRIYTGTGDPSVLLALQAAWAALLWPLAHLMWRGNRERLVTHGG